MNLLEDPDVASDWKLTINAIASLTPLIKQFPWIIPMVRRISGWFLRVALPKLERLLSLQAVGVSSRRHLELASLTALS